MIGSKLRKLVKELNKYTMSRRQLRKNAFLLEIIENHTEGDKTSLIYAIEFMIKLPNKFNLPEYDIHPDGEFSYVWYGKNEKILSVLFSIDGYLNYVYFSKNNNESVHGKFPFNDKFPILKLLIQKFS